MSKRHLIAGTITAAAAAITPAACGGSNDHASQQTSPTSGMSMSSSTAPSATAIPAAGPHNQADITFATDMIPHHARAVQMADMAASKATDAQVTSIARVIEAAQTPEVRKMSGWLTGWGKPVPSASMGGMSGMGSMHRGTGMMSGADMAKLGKATGHAFDRMWVQMMITHHQGAVTMAKTELATGENTDAKKLAQSIITSQTDQISQLKKMLTQLLAASVGRLRRRGCPAPQRLRRPAAGFAVSHQALLCTLVTWW